MLSIPEETRKAVFAALVEAQDAKITVADSRAAIAARFALSVEDVKSIEREGLKEQWPPLS